MNSIQKLGALTYAKFVTHWILYHTWPLFEHVALVLIHASIFVFALRFTEKFQLSRLACSVYLGLLVHLYHLANAAFFPAYHRFLVSFYNKFDPEGI